MGPGHQLLANAFTFQAIVLAVYRVIILDDFANFLKNFSEYTMASVH